MQQTLNHHLNEVVRALKPAEWVGGSKMSKAAGEDIARDRRFTYEEIKAAFWEEFHASGEVWFNYLGTEEECQRATECYWASFLVTLLELNEQRPK